MTRLIGAVLAGAGLMLGATVAAHDAARHADQHQDDAGLRRAARDCGDGTLACASFATPVLDGRGHMWVVWAGNGHVSVARSDDLGRTFAAAVRVTRGATALDTGPDARPQIVLTRRGTIVVGFSTFRDAKYNGQVFVARSTDGGATFTAPAPIAAGSDSRRFLSLRAGGPGQVFAAWVDKGPAAAARAAGHDFAGASLAYAWSADDGATFGPVHIAHDHMCECCRLAVAADRAGRPLVLFRDIFPGAPGQTPLPRTGERDHALVVIDGDTVAGPPRRISADRWAIDACPHHGPSLAVDGGGGYHAAWFTGGAARQGAFYARSLDAGRTFSEPMALTMGGHAQRPFVAASGRTVWVAWKEFDGTRTAVVVRTSEDGGTAWSGPRVAARDGGFTDHPLLIGSGRAMYLSWLTRESGYRLIPLAREPVNP
jgi:hypothetical protein